MRGWLYTIRERFSPKSGRDWERYLAFSGFTNLVELVTLDSILCPGIITELVPDDWNYNVCDEFRTELFRDPDYLMGRQRIDPARHQLLAVYESPDGSETVPAGFSPCGFDIMDSCFGNSTLTNCGPIPEAFAPSDVNQLGLLPDRQTASEVRDQMRRLGPKDPHLKDCQVWRVARRLPIQSCRPNGQ